jgi:hypothetical protein
MARTEKRRGSWASSTGRVPAPFRLRLGIAFSRCRNDAATPTLKRPPDRGFDEMKSPRRSQSPSREHVSSKRQAGPIELPSMSPCFIKVQEGNRITIKLDEKTLHTWPSPMSPSSSRLPGALQQVSKVANGLISSSRCQPLHSQPPDSRRKGVRTGKETRKVS